MQAAGAYKHSIEKALHVKDKVRRRQARIARYAAETDGRVEWPAPAAATQPAPITASRLNFARQRSLSISGSSAGSPSLLVREPDYPYPTAHLPQACITGKSVSCIAKYSYKWRDGYRRRTPLTLFCSCHRAPR
jgi:hypothetical protein